MRRALITGINGQDGFFLKELLLKKGIKYLALLVKHLMQILQRCQSH